MARIARSTCLFQKEPFCSAMPYPVVAKMYLNATNRNMNLFTAFLVSEHSVISLQPFTGFSMTNQTLDSH